MIILKDHRELDLMRESGKIAAGTIERAGQVIKPGVTTYAVDKALREYIESHGAKPAFLGQYGFPGSACISINNELIHGIPSRTRVIKEGDIVSIDTGAIWKGFYSDTAYTFAAGDVPDSTKRLLETTQECLRRGIEAAVVGNRIGDIGRAVEEYATTQGYSVVREYEGHGVGRKLHEEPSVPNFVTKNAGPRLLPGMTIAIEPMINEGTAEVNVLDDDWTVVTADGKLCAHFEHTVAVTDHGPEILTKL